MVRVVDTGDVSFIYTPSEYAGDVVSSIPILPNHNSIAPNRESVVLFKNSPKLRKLAIRNIRLFNRNKYDSKEEYELALKSMLEILPGNKSYIFFGGDMLHIEQLESIVNVAQTIEFKTWVIKVEDDKLLNDYFLGSLMEGLSLPKNVWIYKYGNYGDNVLYDYPKLTYEPCDDPNCEELAQFPTAYKDFTIKFYERE